MENIYKDILKIKDNYEDLKAFDKQHYIPGDEAEKPRWNGKRRCWYYFPWKSAEIQYPSIEELSAEHRTERGIHLRLNFTDADFEKPPVPYDESDCIVNYGKPPKYCQYGFLIYIEQINCYLYVSIQTTFDLGPRIKEIVLKNIAPYKHQVEEPSYKKSEWYIHNKKLEEERRRQNQ